MFPPPLHCPLPIIIICYYYLSILHMYVFMYVHSFDGLILIYSLEFTFFFSFQGAAYPSLRTEYVNEQLTWT